MHAKGESDAWQSPFRSPSSHILSSPAKSVWSSPRSPLLSREKKYSAVVSLQNSPNLKRLSTNLLRNSLTGLSSPLTSVGTAKYVLRQKLALPQISMSPPVRKWLSVRSSECVLTVNPKEIREFLQRLYRHATAEGTTEVERKLAEFVRPKKLVFVMRRKMQMENGVDIGLELLKRNRIEFVTKHYEGLVKSGAKNALALYNLALCRILSKKMEEGIAMLNTAVGILVEKNNVTLLPYAIQLRALASFESQAFDEIIKDYHFYLLISKYQVCSDASLIYYEVAYPLEEEKNEAEKTQEKKSKIKALLTKTINDFGIKKMLFQRKSCQTNKTLIFSSKKKSVPGASPSETVIFSTPAVRSKDRLPCLPLFPESDKNEEKKTNKLASVAHPEYKCIRIRFLTKEEQTRADVDQLMEKIERLKSHLEQDYFREDVESFRERAFPVDYAKVKEQALRNLAALTLSMQQVAVLKREFAADSEDRDYVFLETLLSRLSALSKIKKEDRLLIFQQGKLLDLLGGTTLYVERDEVKEVYVILRGSVGHKIAKQNLGNQEIFVYSSFDGESVGWQVDVEGIDAQRMTTCVTYENCLLLSIPLELGREIAKRNATDEELIVNGKYIIKQ